MGTVGRGEVVRLALNCSRLRAWSSCSGSTQTRERGGHAGDQCFGLLGRQVAASQLGGAKVLVLVGAVDEHDGGDLVRVEGGEDLGDHATIGVADDHVGVGHGGGVEQRGELVRHPR